MHPARYPHVVRKRLLRINTRVDGVRERVERINARSDSIIASMCRFGREGPKIDLHERGAVGSLDERVCDEFRETLTVIDGAAGVVGFEAEDVRVGSICGEWVPILLISPLKGKSRKMKRTGSYSGLRSDFALAGTASATYLSNLSFSSS